MSSVCYVREQVPWRFATLISVNQLFMSFKCNSTGSKCLLYVMLENKSWGDVLAPLSDAAEQNHRRCGVLR